MQVKIQCRWCGQVAIVEVDRGELHRFVQGIGYLPNLFKDLSPADRNLLIQRTCAKCVKVVKPER